MKQKTIYTLLWMTAFAAGTFLCGLVVLAVLAHTRIVSLPALLYLDWTLKVIFFSSPIVALVLGLRGALPGTKRVSEDGNDA